MRRALPVLVGVIALGCNEAPSPKESSAPAAVHATAPPVSGEPLRPPRPSIDGRSFPDKVIALTWDDGPDENTLALATYLHAEAVSATFFVVDEWRKDLSDEPGLGKDVFATGYASIPILGDLVALGHRLGNHTSNHVVLTSADASQVVHQLLESQRNIDPFLTNELPIFRAPGGAWNAAASSALDADPRLRRLIGPIRWDIDEKDWETSLYCRSTSPARECERAGPEGRLRIRASVVAQRYLAAIEAAGHGIVLLHDRVGHVRSSYALQVAKKLIPALKYRGYVFVGPVLAFSSPAMRSGEVHAPTSSPSGLGDVNGDGRADRCERSTDGVVCALSNGNGSGQPVRWSAAGDFVDEGPLPRAGSASARGMIALGDINGDGRADVCGSVAGGIACALSTGRALTKATIWLAAGPAGGRGGSFPRDGETIELRDINGDGRADVCGRRSDGVFCGLAP